jgi:hypothetical protein
MGQDNNEVQNIKIVDIEKLAAEEQQQQVEAEAKLCPHCGYDTTQMFAMVSEEDKKEYLRAILGDRLFRKKFDFMGEISVTLTELKTLDKDRLIRDVAAYVTANNDFSIGDVQLLASNCKLMHTLEELKLGDSIVTVDKERLTREETIDGVKSELTGELYIKKILAYYDELFGGKGTVVMNIVHEALVRMTMLTDALLYEAVTKTDF